MHGVVGDALLAELRDSFDRLDVFPDVHAALAALRETGRRTAILSNGTPSMLTHQVRAGKLGALLDHVLSVEEVGVYKPHPRVYQLAIDTFAVPPERLAFVSSNPWDVFGAHAYGLHAIRLNRTGAPDEYGLRGRVPEIADLAELPALLE
jgi:2-haloacid dehalogenase